MADPVAGGALNRGQGSALTSKLKAALQQLEQGNTQAGANMLQALANQMRALVVSGKLSQGKTGPVIDAVNSIIEQLTAGG